MDNQTHITRKIKAETMARTVRALLDMLTNGADRDEPEELIRYFQMTMDYLGRYAEQEKSKFIAAKSAEMKTLNMRDLGHRKRSGSFFGFLDFFAETANKN
jgi:hypothetical protein